jgi:hypothetical protein
VFLGLVCAAGALPCRADYPPENVQIRLNADATRIEVTGIADWRLRQIGAFYVNPAVFPPDPSAWRELFAVRVAGQPPEMPTVLGALSKEGDLLVYTPRFPFRPGFTYHIVYRGGQIQPFAGPAVDVTPPIDVDLTIPADVERPPATVAVVYPSGDALPQNLLKFYIHFTAPMSRGEAYSRLHIVDVTDSAAPREVPDAFLRLGEELWDSRGERFTLLFDPGRIKRGLVPNLEDGAPLQVGRRYALVIDGAWQDARGLPLADSYRKEFAITPFDDVQPDPLAWKLAVPSVGDVEPLIVTFPEPLDHALLERAIAIKTADGKDVDGIGVALDQESRWMFRPTQPWPAGDYAIVIDPILEDLAGNSVGRAFETQAREIVDDGTSAEAVMLPFKISRPR